MTTELDRWSVMSGLLGFESESPSCTTSASTSVAIPSTTQLKRFSNVRVISSESRLPTSKMTDDSGTFLELLREVTYARESQFS